MDEQSDEALMARVGRGDEPAFRELARRHTPAALALARRIIGSAAEAEDIAQDAFLRVWVNAPRWRPIASFRTWFTRVLVHLCLDRLRRAPVLALEAAGEPADPAPDALARLQAGEIDRLVAAAIAALPERQRVAIVLSYGEGLSNAQTAEILDTSVAAVETLLVRAKQSLRRRLGPVRDRD